MRAEICPALLGPQGTDLVCSLLTSDLTEALPKAESPLAAYQRPLEVPTVNSTIRTEASAAGLYRSSTH